MCFNLKETIKMKVIHCYILTMLPLFFLGCKYKCIVWQRYPHDTSKQDKEAKIHTGVVVARYLFLSFHFESFCAKFTEGLISQGHSSIYHKIAPEKEEEIIPLQQL